MVFSPGPQTLDIFVHMETLRRYGFAELRPGQTLYVRYGRGSKGLMAAELKPDGSPGPLRTEPNDHFCDHKAGDAFAALPALRCFWSRRPTGAVTQGTLTLETVSGPHRFNIEVATTPQERELRLMFRTSLPENGGMLSSTRPHNRSPCG